MAQTTHPAPTGVTGAAIAVLTLATATIHGYLATMGAGTLGSLFLVDAIVYVLLLAALFAPGPAQLVRLRPVVLLALLAWAVATIVAWLVSGQGQTPIGYVDKLIEVVLVAVLAVELRAARRA